MFFLISPVAKTPAWFLEGQSNPLINYGDSVTVVSLLLTVLMDRKKFKRDLSMKMQKVKTLILFFRGLQLNKEKKQL